MLAFTGLIENLPESTGMDLLIPFRLVLQDERMGRDRAERNGTGLNGMGWDGIVVSCSILVLNILQIQEIREPNSWRPERNSHQGF